MYLWTIIDLDELENLEYHGYIRARKSKYCQNVFKNLKDKFNSKNIFILDKQRPDFRCLKKTFSVNESKVLLKVLLKPSYKIKKNTWRKLTSDASFILGNEGYVYFQERINLQDVLSLEIYKGSL